MDKCVKRLGMGITSGKAAKAVENQRARKLYEEIFDEDSPAFVDYYFRVKAAENEIFVVENEKQEILATLHLNPYEMMFCDSATLARDLKYLTANGYKAERLATVDMFPMTVHVESAVKLVRE